MDKTKVLRVFETFSRIGAQHRALEIVKKQFGFDYKIVATSEWDIYANISYNTIHYPHKKINLNIDINRIDNYLEKFNHSSNGKDPIRKKISSFSENIKRELYDAYLNSNNLGSILSVTGEQLIKSVGNKGIDLLTYSFPCQDLSTAGSFSKKAFGMKKGSGTRSGLLWEIERILFDLQKLNQLPQFLLLENVNNMLSKQHKLDYDMWTKSLKQLGYSTCTFQLNALDYGSAQRRKRVYAISILNYDGLIDSNGNILDLEAPIFDGKQKQLKDVLKTNYKIEKYYQEAYLAQPNRTFSRIKYVIPKYDLLNPNCYCTSTITTRQDRFPNGGYINLKNTILGDDYREKDHNNLPKKANFRLLTNREAYLLMGFNEKDFEAIQAKGISKAKMYQQAGNSIVVDVMVYLMKLIQERFNK
ncbi:DNA cytosine methyltransferase [Ureaplasma parvum]|uniref:DNA cytosine methyltransferase n=1 Tax=Ureaplasma parvum TaxID=134821 RepID=UPI0029620701|nr:DNA cytosine methyltransferase [Ureaplasma parvum]